MLPQSHASRTVTGFQIVDLLAEYLDLVIRNRLRESRRRYYNQATAVRVSGRALFICASQAASNMPIGDDILIRNFVPRTRVMTRKEFLRQAVTGSMAVEPRAAANEPPAAYPVPRTPVEKDG